MTHRERVLAAIDRKQPDLLPVGFKASVEVLVRLKEHFGVGDLQSLLEALPVDAHGLFNNTIVGVFPRYVGGPQRVLYPDAYPDGTWDTFYGYKRRWVTGAGGRNEEVISNPLAEAESIAGKLAS